MNLLEKKSPINYEESELDVLSTGKIIEVKKLVLKNENYGDIFRFKEFKSRVIVNSKLKEEIEKAGITGVSFKSLLDFTF